MLLVRLVLLLIIFEILTFIDTPYENVKEGQDWWKTVELPGNQKELAGRTNAIRLFKLPLEE